MPDVQAVFTGALEAGATQFLLSEELARKWSKLAAVDIYTYGVGGTHEDEFKAGETATVLPALFLPESSTAAADNACTAGSSSFAYVKAPDGSEFATLWTLETGDEFQCLQDRCSLSACQTASDICYAHGMQVLHVPYASCILTLLSKLEGDNWQNPIIEKDLSGRFHRDAPVW